MLFASFWSEHGLVVSLGCAGVGLVAAAWLIRLVMAASAGSEKLQSIAAAVQQGARAYLHRQVVSIAAIAAVVFALVWWGKGMPSAFGFLLGAVCSLAAGYIGMRIAVLANVRTTQAAHRERAGAAGGVQWRRGDGPAGGGARPAFGGIFYIAMRRRSGEGARSTRWSAWRWAVR